jgi:hypothetical protein
MDGYLTSAWERQKQQHRRNYSPRRKRPGMRLRDFNDRAVAKPGVGLAAV